MNGEFLLKPFIIPVLFTVSAEVLGASKPGGAGLRMNAFCHCTTHFNIYDAKLHRGHVPNAELWKFLMGNIPSIA